jgi:hypothetical protein
MITEIEYCLLSPLDVVSHLADVTGTLSMPSCRMTKSIARE